MLVRINAAKKLVSTLLNGIRPIYKVGGARAMILQGRNNWINTKRARGVVGKFWGFNFIYVWSGKLPGEPFYNLGALKSVARRSWTTQNRQSADFQTLKLWKTSSGTLRLFRTVDRRMFKLQRWERVGREIEEWINTLFFITIIIFIYSMVSGLIDWHP